MTTLVIHAPEYRVKTGGKSFDDVLTGRVGDGYAISRKDSDRLPPGSRVVLLRKDGNKRRVEGSLTRLVPTGQKTPQGIVRYDVHFEACRDVDYKSEKLNRFGVAVY